MATTKPKWQKEAEDAAIPMAADIPILQEFESVDDHWPGDFATLASRKRFLDVIIKTYEEEKKAIGEQLLLALAMAEVDRVKLDTDGTILKVGHGRSASKIEPTKLLEQGVTVEQIKAATVEGVPYDFAQIVIGKGVEHDPDTQ